MYELGPSEKKRISISSYLAKNEFALSRTANTTSDTNLLLTSCRTRNELAPSRTENTALGTSFLMTSYLTANELVPRRTENMASDIFKTTRDIWKCASLNVEWLSERIFVLELWSITYVIWKRAKQRGCRPLFCLTVTWNMESALFFFAYVRKKGNVIK